MLCSLPAINRLLLMKRRGTMFMARKSVSPCPHEVNVEQIFKEYWFEGS
jgi:hypothetical protein